MLVDAHLDLAWCALNLQRDFLEPVISKRHREGPKRRVGIPTVGYFEAVRASLGVLFVTLFSEPERAKVSVGPTYQTTEQAQALALSQLRYYSGLCSREPRIRMIESSKELDDHLGSWSPGSGRIGLVLLMEGADPILSPFDTESWYQRGVRIVGPAWKATRYCGGTGEPGPLTEDGRQLLAEMTRIGMILDVSHMSDESFFEAIDVFPGPLIASHSNCRSLVPQDRQLSDEMIRRIGNRGGVIGIAFYNYRLLNGWSPGLSSKELVSLSVVADHIDNVCQVLGNARHVGLGTDLDGGFGAEGIPDELDTIADLPKLGRILDQRGYREQEVEAILGGNWLSFLGDSLR